MANSTAIHPIIPALDTERLVRAIESVAKTHPVVFVEQVWEELGVHPWFRRSSKIGPAFQEAARRGIIERSHEVVYTRHTRTNSGRFLWRSRVYGTKNGCSPK